MPGPRHKISITRFPTEMACPVGKELMRNEVRQEAQNYALDKRQARAQYHTMQDIVSQYLAKQ